MHVSKLAPAAAVLAALSHVKAGPTALSSVEASSTATALSRVEADPIAYGLCQTGCNAAVLACNAAVLACNAAVLACNAALGACSATCATATVGLFAPTP